MLEFPITLLRLSMIVKILQNVYVSPVLKNLIIYIRSNQNLSIGLLTEI